MSEFYDRGQRHRDRARVPWEFGRCAALTAACKRPLAAAVAGGAVRPALVDAQAVTR
jgi:hypothetical protein